MAEAKKSIIILGAGFAGLRTALLLEKKISGNNEYEIILADEKESHVYTPDLYEIATTFNKKLTQECLTRLKDSVAMPYEKILAGKAVRFLRDKALSINPAQKTVTFRDHGALPYAVLAVCLGSVTNYYNIPGLMQFSYPLKTLTDALSISCHLDVYFHSLWKKETKKRVAVVVGGGGATGTEFACELPNCLEKICEKYGYPKENVTVTVIEGSNQLAGQGEEVTASVLKRFSELGVIARLSTMIREVTVNSVRVTTPEGEKTIPMDILIWTGGVMPNPLLRESFGSAPEGTIAKNGALAVTPTLQSKNFPEIFAAGDNAYVKAPMLAQVAFDQGRVLAENIAAAVMGKALQPYLPRIKGVIIPLGGKYALLKSGDTVWQGRWMWALRRFVDLGYLIKILPFFVAVKKWIHDTNVFVDND